jgi:hypothetical protein
MEGRGLHIEVKSTEDVEIEKTSSDKNKQLNKEKK